MTGRVAQACRSGLGVAAEMLANILLPYLVFIRSEGAVGQVAALMLATLPPIAWTLATFVRERRIDAVSVLIILGILLSLLAFIGGGGVRVLQLREAMVNGVIGLIFLGSAALRRPLIDPLAQAGLRRKSAADLDQFERLRAAPQFGRSIMVMTLVWGTGLVAQTALSCVMVFAIPISLYLVLGPLIGYGIMGGLVLWSLWYGRRQKRRCEAALFLSR